MDCMSGLAYNLFSRSAPPQVNTEISCPQVVGIYQFTSLQHGREERSLIFVGGTGGNFPAEREDSLTGRDYTLISAFELPQGLKGAVSVSGEIIGGMTLGSVSSSMHETGRTWNLDTFYPLAGVKSIDTDLFCLVAPGINEELLKGYLAGILTREGLKTFGDQIAHVYGGDSRDIRTALRECGIQDFTQPHAIGELMHGLEGKERGISERIANAMLIPQTGGLLAEIDYPLDGKAA